MTKQRWFVWPVILALCLPAQAGIVSRPVKTCGTTAYSDEVAAGCVTIKASEVDADLNAILTGGVNNIEAANIVDLTISTAKLASVSVTTAKLADLGVTSGKLAVGATVNAGPSTGAVVGGLTITSLQGVVTIATLPALVTRGGKVVVVGTQALIFSSGGSANTLTISLKRNGTPIALQLFDGFVMTTTIPAIQFVDTPSAGSNTYTVTVQVSGGSAKTATTFAGAYQALELS